MTSSVSGLLSGGEMFAVVLTDAEDCDGDDDDDTVLYSRPFTDNADERSQLNKPPSMLYDIGCSTSPTACSNGSALSRRDVIDDDNHRSHSNRRPSSGTSTRWRDEATHPLPWNAEPSAWKRCDALPTDAAAAFAVLFLSAAAFPIHFPDGVFLSAQSAGERWLCAADDPRLRAVFISSLISGAISSVLLDCLDNATTDDVGLHQRRSVRQRILWTGSAGVAVFTVVRCIPNVPLFILVVSGLAAGFGLAVVTRVTSDILLQSYVSEEGGEDDVVFRSRLYLQFYSTSACTWRFVLGGVAVTASLGAVTFPSVVALVLLPSTTSWLGGDSASADFRYPMTSVVSNTNETVGGYHDVTTINATVDSASIGSTSSLISSWPLLAVGGCSLVCALGALVLGLFAVNDTSRAADSCTGNNRPLLANGDVTDGGDETGNGSSRWRVLEELLKAYGRREVALMVVVALFIGSQQIFAYFVFVRSFAPVAATSRAVFLAGVCMSTVSLLSPVPIGFAVRRFGRVAVQLPVIVLMPSLLVILLLNDPWSRHSAAFYTLASLWAACDCCLHVNLTAFASHYTSSLISSRSVDGGLAGARSIGHLTMFLIFSCTVNYDDNDHSVWNASRISVVYLLVLFIPATFCFVAAEISLRLRELPVQTRCAATTAARRRGTDDFQSTSVTWATPNASSTMTSHGSDSRRPQYRYEAVVRYPGTPTNCWLPNVNPVAPPKTTRVKPLFSGEVERRNNDVEQSELLMSNQ